MEKPIDIKALIVATHAAIANHVDELTSLDAAIGDGDHGVNMKRGFDAILADVDTLALMPLSDALLAAGTRMVMSVGGASGPLFSTFLVVLGRELNTENARHSLLDEQRMTNAFAVAVDAVAQRGKAREGEKTLLDVLFPISQALNLTRNCADLASTARQAACATIPLKATKGRAAYLGSRSIGHMDPGARSVSLLMDAVASLTGPK